MMTDPTGIIETAVGAFLGWMANHFYSRQASKELKRLNDGFQRDNLMLRSPSSRSCRGEVAEVLAADRRKQLTVRELNELLDHMTTVDFDGESAHLNYFINSVECQDCGWSSNVATSESGSASFIVSRRATAPPSKACIITVTWVRLPVASFAVSLTSSMAGAVIAYCCSP
jgi:hypothetical protein